MKHTAAECTSKLSSIEDALYVIGGKWKLKIIVALREHGSTRFNELQRTVAGISARVLSNELKELEMNGFITRKVNTKGVVVVDYELTAYSDSLEDVLDAMVTWGSKHREKLKRESRQVKA